MIFHSCLKKEFFYLLFSKDALLLLLLLLPEDDGELCFLLVEEALAAITDLTGLLDLDDA